jgi:uncharacterized protein (DUF924 family)
MIAAPDEVLSFWLDEKSPEDWYKADDSLDQEIRERFGDTWQAAMDGKFGLWLTYPSGALAYIVLTDQFSRNMFRGTGKAFASDRVALTASKIAIDRQWDLRIDEPARQFFYMPLMHSESLGDSNLLHAKAHREVIRKFGRFPYRNDALSRRYTQIEKDYIQAGGYGSTVRDQQLVIA